VQTLTAISLGVVLGGGQMNCSSPFFPVNPLGQRPTFPGSAGELLIAVASARIVSAFLIGHVTSFTVGFCGLQGTCARWPERGSRVTSSVAAETQTVAQA
jgi:hypothetical protein